MFQRIFTHLKQFDWIIIMSVAVLIGIGLAEIYSVALGGGDTALLNFKKQTVFVGVGMLLLFFMSYFDFHSLYNFSTWIYVIGIGLLVFVLLFGQTVRGTTGWIEFFGFRLQPAELIKIAVIIILAKYFSSRSYRTDQLRHIFFTGILASLPVILILLQPDFGSAMIIFIFWLAILGIFGLNRRQILVIGLLALIVFATSFFFILKPYQRERVLTFLNPNIASLDQGYNIAQAIIAIGSGGWYGRGLGFGSQSQLKFLPESQNDFIFAVIGEELGLFGAMLVLVFFGVLFFRLVYWLRHIDNNFGIYIILGAVILLFTQMFINIGMNVGLLPVVGISLPFISYGGSSLIASLALIGIVESIIIKSRHI
ncbi:MAG: rod shape-determining protein RodA [bacterium]|nr:rod shape-determining protein RodA [bacterium]